MMLVKEQGDETDIALLESLFNNQTPLFRGARPRVPDYAVLNGDLALAVAITMQGQDPRDFGFAVGDDRSRPFRFILETTGFSSEQARTAAHQAYADRIISKREAKTSP